MPIKNQPRTKWNIVLLSMLVSGTSFLAFGVGYFSNVYLVGTSPFEGAVVSAITALCTSSLMIYSELKK